MYVNVLRLQPKDIILIRSWEEVVVDAGSNSGTGFIGPTNVLQLMQSQTRTTHRCLIPAIILRSVHPRARYLVPSTEASREVKCEIVGSNFLLKEQV